MIVPKDEYDREDRPEIEEARVRKEKEREMKLEKQRRRMRLREVLMDGAEEAESSSSPPTEIAIEEDSRSPPHVALHELRNHDDDDDDDYDEHYRRLLGHHHSFDRNHLLVAQNLRREALGRPLLSQNTEFDDIHMHHDRQVLIHDGQLIPLHLLNQDENHEVRLPGQLPFGTVFE